MGKKAIKKIIKVQDCRSRIAELERLFSSIVESGQLNNINKDSDFNSVLTNCRGYLECLRNGNDSLNCSEIENFISSLSTLEMVVENKSSANFVSITARISGYHKKFNDHVRKVKGQLIDCENQYRDLCLTCISVWKIN